MARARNIKPAFFTNDDLAEVDPLGRLLFVGMWTIADFKGDLEWRPKRIKAQLLPYDDCNVEELAINLDKSGFIRFYSVQGVECVHIPNFSKHQNPHKNEREKGSEIPVFKEEWATAHASPTVEINLDKSRLKRNSSASDRADSLLLIPDSCSLIPDSPILKPETFNPTPPAVTGDVDAVFDYWASVMGKTSSTRLTDKRKTKIKQRLKNYTVDDIKKAIDGCAKSEHHMGGNAQGTVYDDLTLICRSDDDLERFRDTIAKVDPSQIKQQSRSNTDEFVQLMTKGQTVDPFAMSTSDLQPINRIGDYNG
jgi:hypothetical protein